MTETPNLDFFSSPPIGLQAVSWVPDLNRYPYLCVCEQIDSTHQQMVIPGWTADHSLCWVCQMHGKRDEVIGYTKKAQILCVLSYGLQVPSWDSCVYFRCRFHVKFWRSIFLGIYPINSILFIIRGSLNRSEDKYSAMLLKRERQVLKEAPSQTRDCSQVRDRAAFVGKTCYLFEHWLALSLKRKFVIFLWVPFSSFQNLYFLGGQRSMTKCLKGSKTTGTCGKHFQVVLIC